MCVCVRARVWQGKSLGSEGAVQLSDGHQHAWRAPQGRLQSQDLGKHLAEWRTVPAAARAGGS